MTVKSKYFIESEHDYIRVLVQKDFFTFAFAFCVYFAC